MKKIALLLLISFLIMGCGRRNRTNKIDITPKGEITLDKKSTDELIIKDEELKIKTRPVVIIDKDTELQED